VNIRSKVFQPSLVVLIQRSETLVGSFDGGKYCTGRGKYQGGCLKKALDETDGLVQGKLE
jgi:hypothetical protein